MVQRHTPPQVDVLYVKIEAIASKCESLFHVQNHRRMANRQEVSRLSYGAEFFRRGLCCPEPSHGSAVPIILSIGVEHPRVRIFLNVIDGELHAVRKRNVVGILADKPWSGCFPKHPIQGETETSSWLKKNTKPPALHRLQVFQAVISGSVVNHENFEVLIALRQQTIDTFPQIGHSVMNWHPHSQHLHVHWSPFLVLRSWALPL